MTNEHEGELQSWLFDQRGYGTGSGQVSNERDFMEKLAVFVQKNTFFGEFDANKPLNIMQSQLKSPTELQFELLIQEKTKQVTDLERQIKAQIKTLADRRAKQADIERIVQPMEASLRNLRLDLQRLMAKKTEVIEYSKNEATLFGLKRRSRIGRVPTFI